jgi:ABC-type multidrug transport system permease subunit
MSFYNFFFYGTLFSELVLVFVLEGMVGNIFGMCVGVLFSTGEVAIQLLPLIMIPILLYGGLVVNLNDIPEYNRWLQYLSPIRHGYSSVMINQLHTDKLHNIGEYELVVRMAGVNGTIEENILMLGGLFVFFFFSCIIILYIKKKSV